MVDLEFVASIVGTLASAYGRNCDANVVEFWATALGSLTAEQIAKTATQGAKLWAQMPTPKDFIDLALSIESREQVFRAQRYDAEQHHPNLARLARRAKRPFPEYRAEFTHRAWAAIRAAFAKPEHGQPSPADREAKLAVLWAMDQDYPGTGWLEAFSDLRAEFEEAGKLSIAPQSGRRAA